MPRVTGSPRTVALLLVLAGLAMGALAHGTALLAIPRLKAEHDAFARIAAVAGQNRKTVVPPSADLPYRDPAMALDVCRYDVAAAPLRVAVTPFDRGFVSIGFHSRSGIAYYGLTLHAGALEPMTIVVGVAPSAALANAEVVKASDHQVHVTAPEPEGFVTLATPDEAGRQGLDRIACDPEG